MAMIAFYRPSSTEVPMSLIGLVVVLTLAMPFAPLAARAQQAAKVPRIGFLFFNSVSDADNVACTEVVGRGLGGLGWIDGQNIAFESRGADGRPERLPGLAEELARRNVKVVVAPGNQVIEATKRAGGGIIPVVALTMYDPIGSGFIATYARPGGSVTGLTFDVGPEEMGKRLELLHEAAPKTSRVGILRSAASPRTTEGYSHEVQLAAQRLGLTLYSVPVLVKDPDEFERAFADMRSERVDAVIVLSGGILNRNRAQVIRLAMKNKWPTLATMREYPESGGLMSYAPSFLDRCRRAAAYVDKILKGAKPGDLPVEQPTKFELVINLKTAKALGLTIPASLLARADQVLE
jgi:putative ABC transport system substrate-binding protein